MTYPKLKLDYNKLKDNVATMKQRCLDGGISTLAGVTKVFSADPRMAQAYVEGGVDFLADSRIQNIKKLQDFPVPKILLRIPMLSEVEDVVKYADYSLNSELETLRALNEAAKKQDKTHKVVLMADLGDLREGFFKEEDFYEAVEEVLGLEGLYLAGIGVNLTCYGAVIPKPEILNQLNIYKEEIKARYDHDLEIVSGGNSSSVYLVGKEDLPGINNLRLGEALVLGTESAYAQNIEGLNQDAWTLEAQIIECKEKPSVPTADELGLDAFGHEPSFVDRGIRMRAIIGLGKQDIDTENMIPLDPDVIILGGSSDHIIIDVTDAKKDYKVGDILSFRLSYGGILSLCTSEFVEKEVVK
ncbi:MAG: ornithine racemase Orr [Tissierellia bacterium]|nr:ornithine racemase Orr [Tissierellia bacterium]